MTTAGAFTICINQQNKILSVKRRDFPLWDLPGGKNDKSESPENAAVREYFEETGFNIQIFSLSGTYINREISDIQYIFSGKIFSGIPITSGPETAEIRFFKLSNLPVLMVPHRRKQIKNFLLQMSTVLPEPLVLDIYDSWFVKYIKKHKKKLTSWSVFIYP